MHVDTHAFKNAFIRGETTGFVVTAEPPASPVEPPPPHFAEIYGTTGCYHIFEQREAAEFQLSLAATAQPPVDHLAVREVRVENIRDYQLLAGFKTVCLVDRAGLIAQSLRIGDPPLAARTSPPFPGPLPPGLRIIPSPPKPKPLPPPLATPAPPLTQRPRRTPPLVPDPPEASADSAGNDSAPPRSTSGVRPGLFRRLFGWFDAS
jgi:hypothetical protein